MSAQLALDGRWGKLTDDQRILLFHICSWEIAGALIDPEYTHIWQSHMGGAGRPRDGEPDWLTSYNVDASKIVAPWLTGTPPRVVVTKAQLRAFSRALPDAARAKLVAARDAAHAEEMRTREWCHCSTPGQRGCKGKKAHHSEREWDDHYRRCRLVRDQERAALAYALQVGVPSAPAEATPSRARRRHSAAPWTTSDMQVIADNQHLSNVELGRKLGRTADAIKHKRRALTEIQEW